LQGPERKTVLLHFALKSETNQLTREQRLPAGGLNHRIMQPATSRRVKRVNDTETFKIVVLSDYAVRPKLVHGAIIRRVGNRAPFGLTTQLSRFSEALREPQPNGVWAVQVAI